MHLGIHRLFADFEDLSSSQTQRHGPSVMAVRYPVGGDDRRKTQVESGMAIV